MRYYTLFFFLFLLHNQLFAQQSFCEGWEEGYAAGMESIERLSFITPICPIVINNNKYENGYAAGFEKATGKKATAITTPVTDAATFCEGWETGYTNAMNNANKPTFIVPICPTAPINEDTYDAGYIKGHQKAQQKLGTPTTTNWIPTDNQGTYCEGWERGYQMGLQLWAEENNTRKSNRMTPICPIAPINKESYTDAFVRGKKKALEDME